MKMVKKLISLALFAAIMMPAPYVFSAGVVDKVIVVVNDEVVTQREFDRVFEPIQRNLEASLQGDELAARLEEARKGVLEQLVNSKLTISIAKKDNIKVDEEEIAERTDKIKSYYGSEEVFLKALNEKGTNLTEFEQEMRDQMLAQKLVEQEVSPRIVIPPAEIRELYDKNTDKLMAPETRKVRGIMVRKGEGDAEAASREKMEIIIGELKGGKDFSAVAVERSEGPYAPKGGEMGYVTRGQLIKELDDAVFTTGEGKNSDVVESSVGYHVFLVEEIQTERQLEFSEVSEFLREQLYMRKFQEELLAWLKQKRKNAYISYK